MTLEKRLGCLGDGEMIYLGTVGGNSFCEIDTCRNIKNNLDGIDRKFRNNARRHHKESEGEFCWKPFGERQVAEEYPHTADIPGTTLLIEGNSSGSYWLYLEAHGKG